MSHRRDTELELARMRTVHLGGTTIAVFIHPFINHLRSAKYPVNKRIGGVDDVYGL